MIKPAIRRATVLGGVIAVLAVTGARSDEELPAAEADITTTIRLQEMKTDACEATLEVMYYQKGPSVHVETELKNEYCDASSGSYELQVRFRDSNGQIQRKSFEETWERDDAEPVLRTREYVVAENIDVLKVQPRKLRCTCGGSETADAGDDAE